MKRFKKPKKNKKPDEKLIRKIADQKTDEMLAKVAQDMSEQLYPVMLLACKDEFRLKKEQVQKLDKRVARYLNNIGDKLVDMDLVMEFLEKE